MEALEQMHVTSTEAVDPMVMRSLQTVVCRRLTLESIHDNENRDVAVPMSSRCATQDQEHELIAL